MMNCVIWRKKLLGVLSSIEVNIGQFEWREMLEKQVRPPSNWEPSHHVLVARSKRRKPVYIRLVSGLG